MNSRFVDTWWAVIAGLTSQLEAQDYDFIFAFFSCISNFFNESGEEQFINKELLLSGLVIRPRQQLNKILIIIHRLVF